MKKIFEELTESMSKAFELIEQDNKKFIELITLNSDLTQSSYADLDILVTFLEENTSGDLSVEKNSPLLKLQHKEEWLEREVMAFSKKFCSEMLDQVELIQ